MATPNPTEGWMTWARNLANRGAARMLEAARHRIIGAQQMLEDAPQQTQQNQQQVEAAQQRVQEAVQATDQAIAAVKKITPEQQKRRDAYTR